MSRRPERTSVSRRAPAASPAPAVSPRQQLAVIHTTLIVVGILALVFVLWQLSVVFLLLFAAIIIAILLRSIAEPVERYLRLPSPWSVLLAGLLVGAVIAGTVVLLGARVAAEAASLNERLPSLISAFGDELGIPDFGNRLFERLRDFATSGGAVSRIAGYTTGFVGVLANLLLVIVAAVFLAADPGLYRRGVLALTPPLYRERVGETLDLTGRALKLWLLGTLAAMVLVGAATTVGLYFIGVSSALALGLLAGLAEFVPIVGPIAAAIPALLLALPEGGTIAIWVAVLYIVVQQIENNLIVPMIQRHAVQLPPVVMMFSLVAIGILFGPLGLVLAAPLTVFVFVAVKKLYLRDTLGADTTIPGEKQPGK